ncbi:carbamoyl-phosphate synthase large subunit [Candidatus Vidania fulgoroideorum]
MEKIIFLGSGAIIIGQACEFDYSGTQVCKSLVNKNLILINNNPASIMTDYKIAYKTYIEPMGVDSILNIIKKEKPKGIIAGFGGQTALNLLISLDNKGILKKFKIKIYGPSIKSIKNSENRNTFRKILSKNNIPIALSFNVNNFKECKLIRKQFIKKGIKKIVIRPSYTLGGLGGGISENSNDFKKKCLLGFKFSKNNKILLEESLLGWKEIELEILIDDSNFIVVSSMENIDPVGVHTGDSIVVSPILTLTDKEYQNLRKTTKIVIKCLKIKNCGCNIQYAINKKTGKIKVIEVNPRISRSSALASKITGYPIAKISSKLAVGYKLDKIWNEITNFSIPAFFEPCLDYVVIKFPKFCNEKFVNKSIILSPQMRSVGEVMLIASSFEEAVQKSFRALEEGFFFKSFFEKKSLPFIKMSSFNYLYDLLILGFKIKKISKLLKISKWFVLKISEIVNIENEFYKKKNYLKKQTILNMKILGFSDKFFSNFLNISFFKFLFFRKNLKIFPCFKKIDSCSGEFNSNSSYIYSTYLGNNEFFFKKEKKIIILGSGSNKIGQGLEFDFCCTHASEELKRLGYNSILLNCNPETVSTDYTVSNKLFFDPVSFEDLFNINYFEKPLGVIIQLGGQTSLKFINILDVLNIKVLGTSLKSTFISENRKEFKKFLKKKNILQPKSKIIDNKKFDKNIKFPVLVRPSFVLGGSLMKKINTRFYLNKYIEKINKKFFPILIDEYLKNAYEFDIDCVCNSNEILILSIVQHIEKAGIHSGDSNCFFPALISNKNIENIKKIVTKIALSLKIIGLMNVQFVIKNNKIYILEINPRASRTLPILNKYSNIDIISIAIFCILYEQQFIFPKIKLKNDFFCFKAPVFSSIKFPKSDPITGPEMSSTGENLSFGKNFEESFIKTQTNSNFKKEIIVLFKKNIRNLFLLNLIKFKIKMINIFKINRDFLIKFSNSLKSKKPYLIYIQESLYSYKENFFLKKIRIIVRNNKIALCITNSKFVCFLYYLIKHVNIFPYSLNKIHDYVFKENNRDKKIF